MTSSSPAYAMAHTSRTSAHASRSHHSSLYHSTSKHEPDSTAGVQAEPCPAEPLAQAWQPACRPAGAHQPGSADFTVEDETRAQFCEQLLGSSWCATSRQPGHPVVASSPEFQHLTGHTAAELLASSGDKLLHGPKTDPQAADMLAAGREALESSIVQLTGHTKKGKVKKLAVCLVPVLDRAGVPLLCMEFWTELDSSRHRPEAATDAAPGSKAWATQIVQAACGACLTSCSGAGCTITACSSSLCRLTGYSHQELTAATWLSLAGPDTSSSSTRHLIAAQQGSRFTTLKMLFYKKDGSPFWAVVASCPAAAAEPAAAAASAASAAPAPAAAHPHAAMPDGGLLLVLDITSSSCQKVGKYQLGRVLGHGASGIVRIARHLVTDERVAVKAVDATRFHSIGEIEQVQEEMAVLATLRHPNIIRLLEVHFLAGCFYFVMEYASTGSLANHIHQQHGGRLTESVARRIFAQIFSALQYCHNRRVIHRDLKPENILMDGDTPKIADFGLAGVVAPFSGGAFKLQCGTPEFTAPEIVAGQEYEGTAVDLWSAGVMLYEALSGSLPFTGPSQASLLKAIQRGTYAPLPKSISRDVRQLVRRLLDVDPASRISWGELAHCQWLQTAGDLAAPGASANSITNASSSGATVLTCAEQDRQASTAPGSECTHCDVVLQTCSSCGSGRSGSTFGHCAAAGAVTNGTSRPYVEGVAAAGTRAGHDLGGAAAVFSSSGAWPFETGLDSGFPAPGMASQPESCQSSPPGWAHPAQYSATSAISSTWTSCHESVRVVVPDGYIDDPIAAAIKRSTEGPGLGSPQALSTKSSDSRHSVTERQHSVCLASPGKAHGRCGGKLSGTTALLEAS